MLSLELYNYLDYRQYCRDFYFFHKETDPKFSYRYFAKRAKVAPAHLKHVIDGKRNISVEMSLRFGAGMGLSEEELDYFQNLVRFNQASSLDEKTYYFEKLRKKRNKSLQNVSLADAAALLSDWYVIAIKELIVNLNTVDVNVIEGLLRKKLSKPLIQGTIDRLISLGWVLRKNERWRSRSSQICFPDEVKSYVIQSFHRQMLSLAVEALEDPLERREFGSTVFSFPESEIPELKKKVKQLQEEFISYVQSVSDSSDSSNEDLRVYFYGVHCFSLEEGVEA